MGRCYSAADWVESWVSIGKEKTGPECLFCLKPISLNTAVIFIQNPVNIYMLCCRFSVKVTALWAEGSNADVALDDIAVGAACFNRGKLLALCHNRFLEKKNNISITFQFKN